jgi:hypothetical protein
LTAGFYLDNSGDLEVGAVGESFGAVSTSGNMEIVTTGAILVDGVRTAGNVVVRAGSGQILGGNDASKVDIVGANVSISAVDGLGATGAASLDIAATQLVVENRGAGSAYLDLHGSVVLAGTDLSAAGSLFVRSLGGDLAVSGVNTVFGGDATFQVKGSFAVSGDLVVSGQIRVTAQQVVGAGALVESKNGSIRLRSSGDILFDAASAVLAPNGLISTLSGSGVVSGLMEAGLRVVYSLSGTLSGLVYANQFYGTSPSGTKMSVFDYLLEEDLRLRLTKSFP